MKRTLDMRKTLLGDARERPERQTASPIIDIFFMEQYHGAAEDLPENVHTNNVDGDIQKDREESAVHSLSKRRDSQRHLPLDAGGGHLRERAAGFMGPET